MRFSFTRSSSAAAVFVALSLCTACSTTQNAAVAEVREPTPVAAPAAKLDADQLFAAQRWAEAADAYRARVAAKPDDGAAWYRLGYCLHITGHLDEAIEAHTKAATFPALRAAATYNLACAKALKGEKDVALAELEHAVAAGFNDANMLATDTDLATLRPYSRFQQLVELVKTSGEATGKNRELDFWLGDWDVFDVAGTQVGKSSITKAERGRMIHESWTDATGRTGQSMNFVDAFDGAWKQEWVDDKGGVSHYSGELRDGAMCFVGFSTMGPNTRIGSRCTFTPNPDGSVRQFIETQDAQGNWSSAFDGKYVRRRK
ncbi:MAG: hypothetical protein K8S98_07235 [Planctomycetes bacterium]|nr:hypothetical protein [Planctomycetota bacterium]